MFSFGCSLNKGLSVVVVLNAVWLVHNNFFFKHTAAIFRVIMALPVTTESLLSMLLHAKYLSAVTEYLHKV